MKIKQDNGAKLQIDVNQTGKPVDINDSDSDGANSDIAKCPICDKLIPRANLELHKLRCVKLPPAASTGAKPKKKKKSDKVKKQKDKKGEEEDFDTLIAAAMKENTTCNFHKCKEYTTCLGQDCGFCCKRFCLKHHIPEIHGCGNSAKANARMQISREGVLHRGSGVPDKGIDPARRAFLERKMDKKIEDLEEKRKLKKKDKK